MDEIEIKQLCLSVSQAAMALFDLIDEKGIDAPLSSVDSVKVFEKMFEPMYEIKGYYTRRSVQRMLALGVSPETIIKMQDPNVR